MAASDVKTADTPKTIIRLPALTGMDQITSEQIGALMVRSAALEANVQRLMKYLDTVVEALREQGYEVEVIRPEPEGAVMPPPPSFDKTNPGIIGEITREQLSAAMAGETVDISENGVTA
ncbi:MAG: hypothetical protein ACRDGM_18055 [bacterium]